eukprot:8461419-Pyramimonas_sp.AAC.1
MCPAFWTILCSGYDFLCFFQSPPVGGHARPGPGPSRRGPGVQSDLIGHAAREDTGPLRGPPSPQGCRRHGPRDSGHEGTLDLAGPTY